jgi:acetylornithine deacetylase/succinyl-diaminopimelate desuccinylase-like protein
MKPFLRRLSLPGLALALTGAALLPHPAAAQVPAVPADNPRMRAALDSIQRWQAWTLEQQVQLTEIEAPPFAEQTRAEEFRRRLTALGFQNVRIDSEGNVIAERPGTGPGPVVVVSGHLDTVFPKGTDVRVRREGARLLAPGIGDDGRGLAVVLTVARAFQQLQIPTTGTVLFVGTVGEEGQGDLRGVRHLFDKELAGKVGAFLSVDGAELDGKVMSAIRAAVAAEKARWPRSNVALDVQIDTIGIRPAGEQPVTAPIVQVALNASKALGMSSSAEASSTDANIPMSLGIPAITIDGGGRGGASHAPEEWYEDTADSYKGPQWAALIVAALAGLRPASF